MCISILHRYAQVCTERNNQYIDWQNHRKQYNKTMENIEIKFIRTRNKMLRSGIYPSVVTRIIRKDIEKGIYPVEFLSFIGKKKSKPKLRSKFNSNFNLKNKIFQIYRFRCRKCGSEKKLEIDHIKPLVTHPHLALEISNLQVLCRDCHKEKTKKDGYRWLYGLVEL